MAAGSAQSGPTARTVTQVLGGQITVDSSGIEGTAFMLRLQLVAPKTEI